MPTIERRRLERMQSANFRVDGCTIKNWQEYNAIRCHQKRHAIKKTINTAYARFESARKSKQGTSPEEDYKSSFPRRVARPQTSSWW